MPNPARKCIHCNEMFVLRPNKPGKINECELCANEPFTPYMAKVSYPSKNASEVQIEITKNVRDARNFNNAQRHHWCKAV